MQVAPENSKVRFEISNFRVNTVEGTFSGMKGTVNFPDNRPEMGEIAVCLEAASINTDNETRDRHLRGEDYFYTEKYPEICFRSSEILKSELGYVARGTLSMRGVEKRVEIPFSYSGNILRASFTVNRKDYNIGQGTGSFTMGEEVELSIYCQLQTAP